MHFPIIFSRIFAFRLCMEPRGGHLTLSQCLGALSKRRKRSGAQGMPPCSHCRMYKSYFSQMCESIKIFYEMIKVFGFSVGYSASPCAPISNQPKHQTGQPVLLMLSWMALFLLAPIFRLHFYLGRSTQIKRTFSTHFSPSASSASPGTRSRAIPPHAVRPPRRGWSSPSQSKTPRL